MACEVFNLKVKLYVCNFKLLFNHFGIHKDGCVVFNKMEKNLNLILEHSKPSHMTLHRFGNALSLCI
nr:hypothetical protein PHYPA_015375 [Physcomitrium patens]